MAAVAAAQKNREMFAIKKSYSVENGYPSRRRSLVDDARFESFVVKQTKQTVLEEARQRSNDFTPVNVSIKDVNQMKNLDSPTENVKIVESTQANATTNDQNGYANGHTNGHTNGYTNGNTNGQTNGHSNGQNNGHTNGYSNGNHNEFDDEDSGLTEEEIVLQNALSEGGPEAEREIQSAAIVVLMRDGMNSLARIMKSIEKYHGNVRHLETRPNQKNGKQFDLLVRVDMSRLSLLHLIRSLRQSAALESVSLMGEDKISVDTPWFPRHASDLDNCNHLMTKYEPELDMNHPGFADKEYRARRKTIAEIAFSFKYGDTIPKIEYTDDEAKTWCAVFTTVLDLMPKHACIEYRRVFAKLQKEGIFVADRIPQLEEMSAFMKRETGFTLRPAAGLLTARDFLASLAFRVFQSTQYVRHKNSPYHTPEPDCIHELLGHMPLLADPSFAQFSQEIGLASLGASDAEIEKLSTVYWFTVEFGLCKEANQVKAYGAGLLSSYGELLHALSDKPELRAFEPASTAVQPYQDQEYQPIYYVAESFEDAKEKFRRWVSTMSRPFEVRYNPHTGRVEVLDSVEKLESLINQLNTEMLHLSNALTKIKTPMC